MSKDIPKAKRKHLMKITSARKRQERALVLRKVRRVMRGKLQEVRNTLPSPNNPSNPSKTKNGDDDIVDTQGENELNRPA